MHQGFEGGGDPLKLGHNLLNDSVFIDAEECHRVHTINPRSRALVLLDTYLFLEDRTSYTCGLQARLCTRVQI